MQEKSLGMTGLTNLLLWNLMNVTAKD